VWEITGAEFTNQGVHTAEGISIRFPRVTQIRHDKDWTTATTLNELRVLFNKKPESVDFGLLLQASTSSTENVPKKAINASPEKLGIRVKKETSPLDQPSTSFKIKEEPNEVSNVPKLKKKAPGTRTIKEEAQSPPGRFRKKRKGDEHAESSVKLEESEKKKLKVTRREIKQETEDAPLAKIKKEELEDNEQESRGRRFDLVGNVGECFESSMDSDSDVEDEASNSGVKRKLLSFLILFKLFLHSHDLDKDTKREKFLQNPAGRVYTIVLFFSVLVALYFSTELCH